MTASSGLGFSGARTHRLSATERLFRLLLRQWVDAASETLDFVVWKRIARAGRLGIVHHAHAPTESVSRSRSRPLRLAAQQLVQFDVDEAASSPRSSLLWRVGALFLMYSLFETQPTTAAPRRRTKVRLCKKTGAALLRLRADLGALPTPEAHAALLVLDRMARGRCFSFGVEARRSRADG